MTAAARYCMRCGSRLTRDSRVSMCAPCRQLSGSGPTMALTSGRTSGTQTTCETRSPLVTCWDAASPDQPSSHGSSWSDGKESSAQDSTMLQKVAESWLSQLLLRSLFRRLLCSLVRELDVVQPLRARQAGGL